MLGIYENSLNINEEPAVQITRDLLTVENMERIINDLSLDETINLMKSAKANLSNLHLWEARKEVEEAMELLSENKSKAVEEFFVAIIRNFNEINTELRRRHVTEFIKIKVD